VRIRVRSDLVLRNQLTAPNHKKAPQLSAGLFVKIGRRVVVLATAAELVLELFDAACGIDEALLTSEGGVRISGNIADHDLVFNAVDSFLFAATHGGVCKVLRAGRNIDEGSRIELWMDISFHGKRFL